MPIYLKPPPTRHGGPDGKGWNRLSLNAHIGTPLGRCALRPRTYAALVESSRDTRLAQWDGCYAICTREGACDGCPTFTAKPWRQGALTDRILVRILEDRFHPGDPRRLHLMNRPEDGWDSFSYWVTWDEIRRLEGWRIGRAHRDEHGEGFWLEREPTTQQ